ncbi:hypothetical protein GQ42DRAFT_160738 [Ramicandelaber brevisporus]|nr:hypothetical protein GQ42DRAFT_160738 [Ramicandelaber brevisporus]
MQHADIKELIGKQFAADEGARRLLQQQRTSPTADGPEIVTPQQLPPHSSLRPLHAGAKRTLDYRPTRLNLSLNDKNVITNAFWG